MTHRQTLVVALVLVAVLGAMSVAFGTVNPSGGEVRINAKRHEDGRTEFALQQRTADGWSERIAPRGRYLPAEPPVGHWLNSTPVALATEQESGLFLVTENTDSILGSVGEEVLFAYSWDDDADARSFLLSLNSSNRFYRLEIQCIEGVEIRASVGPIGTGEESEALVFWRFDYPVSQGTQWVADGAWFFSDAPRWLLEEIGKTQDGYGYMHVEGHIDEEVSFFVAALSRTDIYPAFEACLETVPDDG